MTLHRYLLEYRLTTAYSQLALSPSPIERIAASCGFATASHFTAAFRKNYGKLPSECRGTRLV